MSPRALPPPDHPDAPKYWRHETGGRLAIAVENFLNHRLMTVRDVALVRAYLIQWIDSPVWEMNPHLAQGGPAATAALAALTRLRVRARRICAVADIHHWINDALAEGHDPL
jgi:hypothetical protein